MVAIVLIPSRYDRYNIPLTICKYSTHVIGIKYVREKILYKNIIFSLVVSNFEYDSH